MMMILLLFLQKQNLGLCAAAHHFALQLTISSRRRLRDEVVWWTLSHSDGGASAP
jgi:hypothetical protein